MLVGTFTLFAIVILYLVLLPMRGYAVTKILCVHVLVADTDAQKPLCKVPIVVFRGPEVREGSAWLESNSYTVNPDDEDVERQRFVTDETGCVEFTWPFEAIIGRNAFGNIGGFLNNTWIQITPPGYGSILIPLNGQSAQRRDFNKETPVVLTVLLKKPKEQE